MEKASFITAIPVAAPRPSRNQWPRRHIVGIGSLWAMILLLWHFNAIQVPSHKGGCHHAGEHRLYPDETIAWKPCGTIIDHELECADLNVPMDQFDEANSGDKTFQIPLIRLRGRNATKNLIVNPGGPGGSGINFIYRRGELLNRIVGEEYHILSFDPRGVNSSRPAASCYPSTAIREQQTWDEVDSDPIRDSAQRYAWTQNFVRACEENMGEHGKYVNTPQTAADMNSILDAVGQRDMIYWGFSYGTLLGQTYASLFPERSHRVIIDGVVDQIEWYTSPFLTHDFVDTQHVLDGFFEECVKSGERCALSELASSKEELQAKVVGFINGLQEDPLPVFVNATTYGILNYNSLWINAIFGHMYKPATWPEFATRLADLLRGNATEAFMAYGVEDLSGVQDDAVNVVHLNDGASGPKYWPKDRKGLLELLLPYYNSSSFAASEAATYYAKQQWRVPRTHNFTAESHVETVHPLLVLSTTYDPICPLVSAKGAQKTFGGSRLIEVKGYGHCSVAVKSTCLANHVRDFLDTGKLPEEIHTTCEADEPYFQKPETEEALMEKLATATTDEAQLDAAQSLFALQGVRIENKFRV